MRPSRSPARRTTTVAVVVALALTACTAAGDPPAADAPTDVSSTTDTSTQGSAPRVAVVLSARNSRPIAEIERQRSAVDTVGSEARSQGLVEEVRTVVPDRFSTMGDVVEMLAEEGNDLVCAIGPGAARAVREVASRFPETLFCAAPGRLPTVPANVLVFDVRVEESAYIAGIAARFAAGESSVRGSPAIIVGDPTQTARLAPAFDAGYLPVREVDGATPTLVATDERSGAAAAESQIAAGAFLVFASAGRAEVGIVEAAMAAGALVIGTFAYLTPLVEAALTDAFADAPAEPGPSESATPEVAPGVPWHLLLLGEDLSAAVRVAIGDLGSWVGGSRSLGFAEGALTLVPGTSPVWERIRGQVLAARDAIVSGDIVVPVS